MLSPECAELLQRSLDSLDYSGNWSDPTRMRDSIVLACVDPEMVEGASGMEYSCRNDKFSRERAELHEHIVERMLASPSPGLPLLLALPLPLPLTLSMLASPSPGQG